MRVDRDRSLLLVIDIQERLALHVHEHEALIARVQALLHAARLFAIPKILTEHCSQELGPVVSSIRNTFETHEIYGKTYFGAADHADFPSMIRASGRTQLVVAGMEGHVCVLQTVLGLLAHGFDMMIVADAVGSRRERADDRRFALERMAGAGCAIACTETVLFEWTGSGDDPAFKSVLGLVKALPAAR